MSYTRNDFSGAWSIGPWCTALLFLGLTVVGCVQLLEPRQSDMRYYLLDAMAADTTAVDTSGITVGLRRPRLASYLDASRIVIRHGDNEIQFSEFHRWGESLASAINRVVALRLEERPGIRSVMTVPWPEGGQFDAVVQLEVLRFEGQGPPPPGPEADDDAPVPEGRSQMVVRWTIFGPEGETVKTRGVTRHEEDGWSVSDYGALVSRLETSLGVLAEELSTRLRDVANAPQAARDG